MAQPGVIGDLSAPSPRRALVVLLRLRWLLLTRSYARSLSSQLGLLITALIFGPASIGIAFFVVLTGRDSASDALIIAHVALAAIYVLWISAPLFGFSLNEAYDPTRLFVYPVALRTILAAAALGSLVEPATLLAAPVYVAVIILYGGSVAGALISTIAVALFALHTLAIAQYVMLSLIGLLRSRRFRDATIVIVPFIAAGGYLAQRLALSGYARGAYTAVPWANVLRVIDCFPPGWAARACVDAAGGQYGYALLRILALLLAVFAPAPLAAAALGRLYRGERGTVPAEGSGVSRAVRARSSAPRRSAASEERSGSRAPLIGGDIAVLSWKERLYLLREPQFKALIGSALYTAVVMLFGFGVSAGHVATMGSALLRHTDKVIHFAGIALRPIAGMTVGIALVVPTFLLLSTTQLLFNVFGGEGSAITVLLSFPTPRRRLLIGKNFAYSPLAFVVVLLGTVASTVLLRVYRLIPLEIAWILATLLIFSGIGNLVSVRFPLRMVVRGQRWQSGGNVGYGGAQGCGYAYLQLFCYFGALMMLFPVACAFVLPPLLNSAAALWTTVPLSMAYAGIIYWVSTLWATSLLLRRESDMIAALAPEE